MPSTMTTIELKEVLIHRISEINDISYIKAIETILDSKTSTNVIHLSSEQRNEIIESKMEIEKLNFIDHSLLDSEVAKWLNEK